MRHEQGLPRDPRALYDLERSFGTALGGSVTHAGGLEALTSMGHTDIKMTTRYVHPLGVANKRVIGKLETPRKPARPALAQAVKKDEWAEAGT